MHFSDRTSFVDHYSLNAYFAVRWIYNFNIYQLEDSIEKSTDMNKSEGFLVRKRLRLFNISVYISINEIF
jgi:hypothetical protein